jgi:recombination protein RecA
MAKKKKKSKNKEKKAVSTIKGPVDLVAEIEKLGASFTKDLRSTTRVSTGILPLDMVLTPEGGFGVGCAEIFGPECVGKTSLVLSMLQKCKEIKRVAFLVDVEFRLTESMCNIWGLVPGKDFLLKQPDDAEDALNSIERFLRVAKDGVVILDTIAVLLSNADWEDVVEGQNYNPATRHLDRLAKKVNKLCKNNNHVLIFLNQIRDNMKSYGSDIRVPGPRSVKHATSWRVSMFPGDKIKDKGDIVGHKVKFKVEKNNFTRPYQTAESTLIYGRGFHAGFDLIELSSAFGLQLFEMSNSRYVFYDDHKAHGIMNAANYVMDTPNVKSHFVQQIQEALQ